jgi:rhamnose utilization protein RhaD (predicted bifunctional aldolase and dehydrogenase)
MSKPSCLKKISLEVGRQAELVQGAGGNTSYKQDKNMWIKASGKWLANAEKEDIFVLVDLERIRGNIAENVKDPLDQAVLSKSNLRPSIETTLHALMPHKVVLHTHPIELLNWLAREDGKELISEILQDFSWAWVPYARPGIDLTNAVQKTVDNKDVDVLLLGSHGLVVGGDSCDHAAEIMDKVLSCCKTSPRSLNLPDDQFIKRLTIKLKMRVPKYSVIHSLALDSISFKYCNQDGGVLYPDQAVFLGASMPCYDEFKMEYSNLPFVIIKGKGVFISNNAKYDVDEILRCHAEVLLRIDENERLRYLTENEIGDLLDWEPEKYRKRLSR